MFIANYSLSIVHSAFETGGYPSRHLEGQLRVDVINILYWDSVGFGGMGVGGVMGCEL
jgi:hypothetical protein